jgi:hypothetical protein
MLIDNETSDLVQLRAGQKVRTRSESLDCMTGCLKQYSQDVSDLLVIIDDRYDARSVSIHSNGAPATVTRACVTLRQN